MLASFPPLNFFDDFDYYSWYKYELYISLLE